MGRTAATIPAETIVAILIGEAAGLCKRRMRLGQKMQLTLDRYRLILAASRQPQGRRPDET